MCVCWLRLLNSFTFFFLVLKHIFPFSFYICSSFLGKVINIRIFPVRINMDKWVYNGVCVSVWLRIPFHVYLQLFNFTRSNIIASRSWKLFIFKYIYTFSFPFSLNLEINLCIYAVWVRRKWKYFKHLARFSSVMIVGWRNEVDL